MLVLSRKVGERIYIGDDITVTILDIDRGKIRLGFDAPRAVPIFRTELVKSDPSEKAEPKQGEG